MGCNSPCDTLPAAGSRAIHFLKKIIAQNSTFYKGFWGFLNVPLRGKLGAEGRGRTDTGVSPHDFESCASANSATPASHFR